jgi:hypothetical protein
MLLSSMRSILSTLSAVVDPSLLVTRITAPPFEPRGAATSRGASVVVDDAVGHGGRRATNGTMASVLADNPEPPPSWPDIGDARSSRAVVRRGFDEVRFG